MKNSETDREITELIKSALDDYREDYIPGAWEDFVNIRKRQQRVVLLRIASAIAACLVIGLLGFNYFSSDSPIKMAEPIVNRDQNQIFSRKDSILEKTKPTRTIERSREIIASRNNRHQGIASSDLKTVRSKTVYKGSKDAKYNDALVTSAAIQDSSNGIEKNSSKVPSLANAAENSQNQSGDRADSTRSKSGSKQSKPSENKFFNDADLLRRFAANDIQNPEKRKIRIGINFSPGVSSTQMGSAFTYSGGVSTDITLFSNILLSTGLQIEHQSVKNGNNATASLSAAHTKADLVNLDLPLNITWKFISGKSKSFYVSGGVSSLAYLSEKYDKTMSIRQIAEIRTVAAGMEKLSYKMENIETKSETTEPSFNSFDIAGRLNLIFGMEQRLSPKLYLHIEPYMKIPVSGLATENLRFSTGGVTCKISF